MKSTIQLSNLTSISSKVPISKVLKLSSIYTNKNLFINSSITHLLSSHTSFLTSCNGPISLFTSSSSPLQNLNKSIFPTNSRLINSSKKSKNSGSLTNFFNFTTKVPDNLDTSEKINLSDNKDYTELISRPSNLKEDNQNISDEKFETDLLKHNLETIIKILNANNKNTKSNETPFSESNSTSTHNSILKNNNSLNHILDLSKSNSNFNEDQKTNLNLSNQISESESINFEFKSNIDTSSFLIPQKIVEELNKHIIGQNEAKRNLAVALRDRWRRSQIQDTEFRREITPNNILLIGPSGCGKTELAKRLAAFAEAPFVKVVATKYTEVGFVGDDTQSMVMDLAEQALSDEKKKQRKKMGLQGYEKTLNYIKNCVKKIDYFKDWTDDLILEYIKNGKLDDLEIAVDTQYLKKDDPQSPLPFDHKKGNFKTSPIEMTIAAVPYNDISSFVNNMFTNSNKKKSKDDINSQKKLSIKEASPLLLDTFINELINDEDLYESARQAAEQRGIIFIDEFDKIIDSKEGIEIKSKRKGVQKELLSLMEGATVTTQLGRLSTDHILFIASGAFTTTKPSEIMPELLGRLPIRCELKPLTESDFCHILKDTRYNLLMQQKALLSTEGVELDFAEGSIEEIAKIAYRLNTETSNVGARRLKSVMAKILEDIKFDAPHNSGKKILITVEHIKKQLYSLMNQSDLSKYII